MLMNMEKRLPKICPSCGGTLRVRTMHCAACGTNIEGDYRIPALMRLSDEDRQFVRDFVMCRGSLKEMASKMGLSYPSVRNRLDEVIDNMKNVAE